MRVRVNQGGRIAFGKVRKSRSHGRSAGARCRRNTHASSILHLLLVFALPLTRYVFEATTDKARSRETAISPGFVPSSVAENPRDGGQRRLRKNTRGNEIYDERKAAKFDNREEFREDIQRFSSGIYNISAGSLQLPFA